MEAVPCAACGHDNRATAKFCDECGTALATTLSERKQVTVLFCDVVGSMKLATTLDPERLQQVMHQLFNRSALIVQRYQGTVDKFTGDGLMALFGAPIAVEDHALRACIAALEIQSAAALLSAELLRRDDIDLRVRVGLNSGEVITGAIGSGFTAVGHPVGMAQRMEAAAPSGGVLLSDDTARLVERTTQLGPIHTVAVKGEAQPVIARQLLSVATEAAGLRDQESVMLGRDSDLQQLLDAFESTTVVTACIVGAPGLGKSRLIRELAAEAHARAADVVISRCDSHTADVPLSALSRLLRAVFGIARREPAAARNLIADQLGAFLAAGTDHARVVYDLLGISDPADLPLQLNPDARRRRLVEVMAVAAKARPSRTIFILEDIHWIDTASEEILSEFVLALEETQSMYVANCRPEYQGPLREQAAATIVLAPLADTTTLELVDQLIGEHPSLAALTRRIAVTSAGNPFFVEEIVRDMAGRGVLTGSRGDYRLNHDVDDVAVPATVQSVIAARIDRLPPRAKRVLNAAAVIGSRFGIETLTPLVDDVDAADLAELVAAELIDQTQFLPEHRYTFRHPLIRTVAYESQLSTVRANAHRRLVNAIQGHAPDAVDENAALIATHLEAAGDAELAYGWHMRAAEWLRSRDIVAARTSWLHASHLADGMPSDHEYRTPLRLVPRTMLALTDFQVGGPADSAQRYAELRDMATQSADTLALAAGTAGRALSLATNGGDLREAAALAAELASMVDDIDGEVSVKVDTLWGVTWPQFLRCDLDAAEASAQKMQELAAGEWYPTVVWAASVAALIKIFRGDHEAGRQEFKDILRHARQVDILASSGSVALWSWMVCAGMEISDDTMVAEIRELLEIAETSGDNFTLGCARFAYATALSHHPGTFDEDAVDALKSAQAVMVRHNTMRIVLPCVETDLAMMTARDEAIESLRRGFHETVRTGSPLIACVPSAALVDLLIERDSGGDRQEAADVTDELHDLLSAVDVPVLNLFTMKCRAKLARAAGDAESFKAAAQTYLTLVESLDARGQLAEARLMVAESSMMDR